VIWLKIDLRDNLRESLAKYQLESTVRCAVHVEGEFQPLVVCRFVGANGGIELIHECSLAGRTVELQSVIEGQLDDNL